MRKKLMELEGTLVAEYDEGLASEINAFFEYQNLEITLNTMKYLSTNNSYEVSVTTNDKTLIALEGVFQKFVSFLKYGESTFYYRSILNNEVNYTFVSFMNEYKGFVIHLSFEK